MGRDSRARKASEKRTYTNQYGLLVIRKSFLPAALSCSRNLGSLGVVVVYLPRVVGRNGGRSGLREKGRREGERKRKEGRNLTKEGSMVCLMPGMCLFGYFVFHISEM